MFAGENRSLIDAAIQRHRRQRGKLHCVLVQHRECAGHPQTNRANVAVGRSAEAGRAGAENLARRQQVNVNFQADDRLEGGLGGGGGRHTG